MHIHIHLVKDFRKVLYAVGLQAFILYHFLYGVRCEHLHLHASGIAVVECRVRRILHNILTDENHCIIPVIGNNRIKRLVSGGKCHKIQVGCSCGQFGHHYPALVYHCYLRVIRGRQHHYGCRSCHQEQHQHRHEQGCDYKTLFPYALVELTRYDYSYIRRHFSCFL